ncbi:hypothetical protein CYY_007815 [Polysphondylium violaceum]|uniref:Uncharacterized protein n=1 Tax=Polysphondylium violaceum TaxID=133409 RepID=A0A8J4V4L3_9MYCE|nr:hypothetical protein CYY_007815 [Polysphondylium violaceum]
MKNILNIIVLLCVIATTSCTLADTYSVGISNNENNSSISIGLVDLTSGNQALPKLTINGFIYQSSDIQPSTYNYVTKTLTFYGVTVTNKYPYLFVIDCNAWRVVSQKSVYPYYSYGGLASTNTVTNNLFTVYYSPDYLHPSTVNPSTLSVYKFDTIYGSYRGSVYLPTINSYYVAFTNSTGLYIRLYDATTYKFYTEASFGFANNPYPVNNWPLNLVYNFNSKTVLAQVYMTDSNNRPYYALAYLDWNNKVFDVTNMDGYSGDVMLSTVADSQGQQLIYSFAYSFGQYVLYTYSSYTNSFLSFRPYLTPILSTF